LKFIPKKLPVAKRNAKRKRKTIMLSNSFLSKEGLE
jgi:hypothetical protein